MGASASVAFVCVPLTASVHVLYVRICTSEYMNVCVCVFAEAVSHILFSDSELGLRGF